MRTVEENLITYCLEAFGEQGKRAAITVSLRWKLFAVCRSKPLSNWWNSLETDLEVMLYASPLPSVRTSKL